ncbi:dockerin type I repeat-containing protein [Ruminococcus callidus]|uniref:dockerin type I repeat-containing protein n=1 Tax=Ruminococcus callidus TaxID=40519 RepID=UPI003521857D
MKLWRKLLAAVTAGTICLGSIGAMLSVSAETESDSSAVSENSTEVKASKGAHTHYYGEYTSTSDGCTGWRGFVIKNMGSAGYAQMGDSEACQYAIDHGFAPNEGDKYAGFIWLGTNPPTITTTKVTTKTTTKMTTKTTTTTTQPSVPTVKEGSLDKGDIDGSGSLDSTDVFYSMLYIANTAVGNTVKISKEQVTAADVDESSSVDATDVYYLMYYIALHGVGVNVSWDDVLAK